MITESRSSGILLHITSLPSKFGIGDLGPESHKFVNLLAHLKQRYWSILPLNPTSPKQGNSPYKTHSAFAGNTLLVSPELLVEDGLLPKERIKSARSYRSDRVNYKAVQGVKEAMLSEAYAHFIESATRKLSNEFDFETFCREEAYWLDDYSLYAALKDDNREPWYEWPHSLSAREASALQRKKENLKEEIRKEKFAQYVFFNQWRKLKGHCEKTGVKIVGDLSFYVDYDSADVWAHPELFKLNKDRKPEYVAGVPPDYFSKTGQLWGTPVYQWRQHKKEGFEWWLKRINHNLKFCDVLRLDHFRGFIAYWQVPAFAKTAKGGRWIRAPSKTFFKTLQNAYSTLPFIAEDLGAITDPVRKAIRELGIPGMRVLVFAFDGSNGNPNLPRNHTQNSVVYTGTHDTNTVRGWFKEEATAQEKKSVFKCLGHKVTEREVSFEFLRIALASKANLSIVPVQDILGLGSESRMNYPAKQMGNWEWRITSKQLGSDKLEKLQELAIALHRASL